MFLPITLGMPWLGIIYMYKSVCMDSAKTGSARSRHQRQICHECRHSIPFPRFILPKSVMAKSVMISPEYEWHEEIAQRHKLACQLDVWAWKYFALPDLARVIVIDFYANVWGQYIDSFESYSTGSFASWFLFPIFPLPFAWHPAKLQLTSANGSLYQRILKQLFGDTFIYAFRNDNDVKCQTIICSIWADKSFHLHLRVSAYVVHVFTTR